MASLQPALKTVHSAQAIVDIVAVINNNYSYLSVAEQCSRGAAASYKQE